MDPDDFDSDDFESDDVESDREADLEEVRAEVARLTTGHKVLELGADDDLAQRLDAVAPGEFSAVVIEFAWSRLTRDEQEPFLKRLRARVGKDALLVLLDEDYVEGSSPAIARTDAQGNTWHVVTAADGSRSEVPRNYPTDSALRKRLAASVREIKIARWEYFWLLSCRLK